MSEAVLLVGTRKGLWIGRSDDDREQWEWSEPEFLMQGIYATCIDTRGDSPRMFVSGTSEHWGPGVYRSDDLGRTWTETQGAAVRFPEDLGSSVERVWQIQPGPGRRRRRRSTPAPSRRRCSAPRTGARASRLIRSLWDHPHRTEWGAGFGGQAIHTIVPHPDDGDRLTVAMSTGGVYQTEDGGDSWAPSNTGIKAYFFPDPWPEFGQCVHKVASHPAKPHRCTPRTTTASTAPTTAATPGCPSPTGCRRTSAFRSWSIRTTPTPCTCSRWWPTANGSRRRVRRGSGGRPTPARRGQPPRPDLPDRFYAAVMRDAFTADNAETTGLYFGARDGSVYGSTDGGERWTELVDHLPDVLSVRAALV